MSAHDTEFRPVRPSVSALVDVTPVHCRDIHDEEFAIVDLVDNSPVPCANPPGAPSNELSRRWRPRLVGQQDEYGGDSLLAFARELADLTTSGSRDSNRRRASIH